jgi:hypothetical protein
MDKYQLFLNTTEDPINFIIKDVIPDGDCGFRSCALNLNLYNLNLIKSLDQKEFKKINCLDTNYKKINTNKHWNGWEYNGKKIDLCSKKLREIIIKYLIEIWDKPISDIYLNYEMFNTLGEFTLNYHNLKDKEEYYNLYINNIDKESWIGSPEFYAMSKLFGVKIEIYGLIRFFKNKESTEMVKLYKNGKVPINTRLRLIQVIGDKYSDHKHQITLLYELDKKGLNHYLFLRKKKQI